MAIRVLKGAVNGVLRDHDDIYDYEYYNSIESESRRSAGPIVSSVLRDLAPRTLVDIGCGTGALLEAFAATGVTVAGMEHSRAALQICRSRGLSVYEFDLEATTQPPPIDSCFDVVVSMEVAEHLPSKLADRFVNLLVRYGNTVVFTAATPGQSGTDHVNEQPHEYWIAKFADRGFTFDADRSLVWRKEWESQGTATWYYRNVMLFRSRAHP